MSNPKIESGAAFALHHFAFALGDGALEHLAIQIEADRFDVPMLLASQDISGAAQFEIQRGNAETGAQIAEFLERGKPLTREPGERAFRRHQ